MESFGTCPHCHVRVALAAPLPSSGRCDSCGGGFLLVVPEEVVPAGAGAAGEPSELDVQLVPHGSPWPQGSRGSPRASWLAARGLRRPLVTWAVIAVAALVALIVVGLLSGLLSESFSVKSRGFATAFTVVLLLIGLPLTALLAVPMAQLLFGERSGKDPQAFWRSVIALTLGITVLAIGVLALPYSLRLVLGAGWSASLLAFALALALAMTPFGWQGMVAALFYLLYVPLLLLGAWLRARFDSGAAPRATA